MQRHSISSKLLVEDVRKLWWSSCCPLQGVASVVGHLQEELAAGLAKLTGAPDLAAAAEQLRQEPMFCVETGGGRGGISK
jgi:hypothetical protein